MTGKGHTGRLGAWCMGLERDMVNPSCCANGYDTPGMPGSVISDNDAARGLTGAGTQHAIGALGLTATLGTRRACNLTRRLINANGHPEVAHPHSGGLPGFVNRVCGCHNER